MRPKIDYEVKEVQKHLTRLETYASKVKEGKKRIKKGDEKKSHGE